LYVASAVIQEIDTSQTGNPDNIATALIARADAHFDAQQAAAATVASTVTNAAPAQDTVPQARAATSLRDQANEAIRVSLRLDRYQAQDRLPYVTAEGTSGDLLAAYRSQLQQETMTADIARLNEADNPDIPCTCPDCAPDMYTTYYLIKVAASLLLTALERLQVNGRPATVLHYYTILIKDLIREHRTEV
jgi:hypothetical protein